MDLIWKFVGCLVSLLGPAIQLWASIKKSFNWIKRAKAAVGPFGLSYAILYKVPLWVKTMALLAIIFASLVALGGGVVKITDGTSSKTTTPPSTAQGTSAPGAPQVVSPSSKTMDLGAVLRKLPEFLFDKSLWLVFAYFVLAVLVCLNVFQWFLILVAYPFGWVCPKLTYTPGWINAHWHVRRGGDAIPVNTDLGSCNKIANRILTILESGNTGYRRDYAESPKDIPSGELANLLLIANTIESCIHDYIPNAGIKFKDLYDALATSAKHEDRPFLPKHLIKTASESKSLYGKLREIVSEDTTGAGGRQEMLPEQPGIEGAVNSVVKTLAGKYDGCALGLANDIFRKDSARLVIKRLKRLAGFDKRSKKSMRIEFLKLAYCWGVWPDMEVGPFIYPFSKRIARLLLNTGCLRTDPGTKNIPLDDGFERLTAWTMDQIVSSAEGIINMLGSAERAELNSIIFDAVGGDFNRWFLCREIDYFIWSQSREENGGCFACDLAAQWQLEGQCFVKEK